MMGRSLEKEASPHHISKQNYSSTGFTSSSSTMQPRGLWQAGQRSSSAFTLLSKQTVSSVPRAERAIMRLKMAEIVRQHLKIRAEMRRTAQIQPKSNPRLRQDRLKTQRAVRKQTVLPLRSLKSLPIKQAGQSRRRNQVGRRNKF